MKIIKMNIVLLLPTIVFLIMNTNTLAQSEPILYFCKKYDSNEGEVGLNDKFEKGTITVMVRCDYPLNLSKVTIQYDKYNFTTGNFDFYKRAYFNTENDKNYLSFSMDEKNEMEFNEPGFYRVFLLDENDKTVASALIEIID